MNFHQFAQKYVHVESTRQPFTRSSLTMVNFGDKKIQQGQNF